MAWGTLECREMLVSLMSDSGERIRTGFSHEDAKTIFLLLDRHDALFPHFDKTPEIAASAGSPATRKAVARERTEGNGLMHYIYPFLALIAFSLAFKAYKLFF